MNSILDQNSGEALALNAMAKSNLTEASKWARFLGILGFIASGLTLIMGIFMGGTMGTLASMGGADTQLPGFMGAGFFIFFYIIVAIISFIPSYFLFTFGSKTKSGIEAGANTDFENGLKNLKRLFKFYGIIAIIFLGFYALMFVFAIFGGIASAF
ncbi:hypothetical protein OO013_11230 [Mangrovivirga sp. M17]|uniref:DUF5362 domain-containing protein n=1 Tax=Mangrovivirga halotolerans TaxID=2993936 RepID=A0ABT3RRN2_9BACT|nr:hypothetical protein [Mangrovivirga halotolerans]MCX2744443.1 hypothetical protein [Mangrovivirga halotolerans]